MNAGGKIIWLSAVSCVLLLLLITAQTVMHEEAHEQIAYNTGGYNCSIEIGFGYGLTHCSDFGNNDFHAWNEIIGYNMLVIAEAIIVGAAIVSAAILIK